MNQHLSWAQISKCLIGDGTPEEAQHARQCAACGAVMLRAESSLADLRSSVREWSEVRPLRGVPRLYAGNKSRTFAMSVLLHITVLALVVFAGSLKPVQKMISHVTPLFAPVDIKPLKQDRGGGGGGAKQPLVKKDQLPKPSPRQFTPPKTDVQQASIMVAPTINVDLPDLTPANTGNLTGVNVAMNGGGAGGGIGKGYGGGIGNGRGNGVGDGAGGGMGGGYRIGNGVSAPTLVFSPEPEYSEDARKAKLQGVVRLALVVDERGNPTQIKVTTPLGLGLDQKAIEAVQKWKFKPGMKDGKPVAVQASVEVNFRLL
jgi:protein TonB